MGVLVLGRLGQGVGLLSDVLAAAAAESGQSTCCEELHGLREIELLVAARSGWEGVKPRRHPIASTSL